MTNEVKYLGITLNKPYINTREKPVEVLRVCKRMVGNPWFYFKVIVHVIFYSSVILWYPGLLLLLISWSPILLLLLTSDGLLIPPDGLLVSCYSWSSAIYGLLLLRVLSYSLTPATPDFQLPLVSCYSWLLLLLVPWTNISVRLCFKKVFIMTLPIYHKLTSV